MLDDPLLTPEKAARRIGVHPETVRRWIRNDAITYENIGPHRKKIRLSVVESLSPKISAPVATEHTKSTHEVVDTTSPQA